MQKHSDYNRHRHETAQQRRTELAYVATTDYEVQTKQQHRVKHHFLVRHHTLRNRKDIAEKMVEKRCMVYKMHTCTKEDKQTGCDDCFFT